MKLRILVIDEDPATCQALVIGLKSDEWTVDSVTDGASGIEQVGKHSYDLLISDIKLSDIDGMMLLKEIRHKLPDIMVLVHTGQSCVDILDEEFLREVNGFCPKPLGLSAIKKAIQVECKKSHRGKES